MAWRIATAPVMAPGYVRCHPKVMRAEVDRGGWDGSLLASIDLITPWPHALCRSREWRGGRWWRNWPTETLIGDDAYYGPSGEDLAKDPYLLTSASLRFAVLSGHLPHPPVGAAFTEPDPPLVNREDLQALVETAQQCVDVLADELNRVVAPVIGVLGQS